MKLTICFVMVAATVFAGSKTVSMITGTNGTASAIVRGVSGYVEEISVAAVDGTSTGVVAVSYARHDGAATAVSIATGNVNAAKLWRPRVDATGVDGEALSSDEPVKIYIDNEPVTFAISGSATNKTWRGVIKYAGE